MSGDAEGEPGVLISRALGSGLWVGEVLPRDEGVDLGLAGSDSKMSIPVGDVQTCRTGERSPQQFSVFSLGTANGSPQPGVRPVLFQFSLIVLPSFPKDLIALGCKQYSCRLGLSREYYYILYLTLNGGDASLRDQISTERFSINLR